MTDRTIKGYTSDSDGQAGERNVYRALSDEDTAVELDPRLDLKTYSDEFAWGATSDAALQLGLAILADYFTDDIAMQHHEAFTEQVIARNHADAPLWIPATEIENALQNFEARSNAGQPQDSETGEIESVTIVPGDEGEPVVEDIGRTHRFSETDFVAVDAGQLHVWHEDTHYVGAGTANKVEPGDVFYFPQGLGGVGPPVVTTVEDVTESQSGSAEYPDAVLDVGDRMNIGFLIGAPMSMGQQSPPEFLVER
ncbi:DUF6166 domain-containing protein [Haloarcula onubensis]|uniref:DUF6166 domain-containing protein n=1 Tax=Haloarcula onubensis TaxID=2950539 RepID=A0ABU2FTF5_9EURY|nr:DUF6166 domain-containing protein [Halomicroarcula sp. S3CR25-11]MDS0284052.1 DUF6166 domain-containing protein [Halomicroarcula sp. S3CR25-11]